MMTSQLKERNKMYITKNKEFLEQKCEGVYHTEGVAIANKLLIDSKK